MAGLEQHAEHLAPQLNRRHALEQLDAAFVGHALVFGVARLERLTGQVVQVRAFGRGEQRPVPLFDDTLHEQVGNPVGGVHVVGATTIVAGVLAQVEELLDVHVPGFQVGAHGALALAALVDRHGGVIGHFQEGHDALRLAVGALDVGAHGANARPVVTETARKLGKERIVANGAENAVKIIRNGGQIAGRELRAQGAGVEQGRGAAHEIEGREQLVELDGTLFAVDLIDRKPHRHAHEEGLRQLDAMALMVDEVAVVQGLQTEIGELQVTVGVQRLAEAGKVIAAQFGVEQFMLDALENEGAEGLGIAPIHIRLGGVLRGQHQVGQRLGAQLIHQQACRDVGIIGILLDQGPSTHDQRSGDLVLGHAVIQVAQGLVENRHGIRTRQSGARLVHQRTDAGDIQGLDAAIIHLDVQHTGWRSGISLPVLLGALTGAGFTVQNVSASDLVMPFAHQRQFDLILHVLDVDRATTRRASLEGRHHGFGQFGDRLMDTHGGRRRATLDRQKGLGQGNIDLAWIETSHLAITAHDAELTRHIQCDIPHRLGGQRGGMWLLDRRRSRSGRNHDGVST